ncbi:hypothetical protein ACWEU6_22540 [Streptosporangium sandarakinum]|uniref:hypothetical protein n=1 Tax=Streptosporangium sandarakinum TaxID=1260955 RepID=UPI0036C0402D
MARTRRGATPYDQPPTPSPANSTGVRVSYQQADPQALVDRPANPLLVDCRTALDADPWRVAGWIVHQLGRPGK